MATAPPAHEKAAPAKKRLFLIKQARTYPENPTTTAGPVKVEEFPTIQSLAVVTPSWPAMASVPKTHNISCEVHNIRPGEMAGRWRLSPEATDAVVSFCLDEDKPTVMRIPWQVVEDLDKAGISGKQRDSMIHFCGRILMEGCNHPDKIGVPMNAEVMRQAYAERGPDTVRLAVKLGLVEMVTDYSSGLHSRVYWFTNRVDLRQAESVEIRNASLIRRLRQWKRANILRAIKKHGAPFDRLLVDLCALKLSDRGIRKLEQFIETKEPNTGALPTILNRFISGRDGWFSMRDNLRLATHVTGLPSSIRGELTIEDEPMVELDINCSHVAQMVSLFSPGQRKEAEYQEIVDLIRSRRFYALFKTAWAKGPDDTKSEKILFQKLINDQRPTRADLPMWKELENRFPVFTSVLVSLKRSHRSRGDVANYIQGREAQLIRQVVIRLHQKGIKCYTVYDSIGVPLRFVNVARTIFDEELESRLGFALPVRASGNG
jgi:hypothetical protein